MKINLLKKILLLIISGVLSSLAFSFPRLFFLNWFSLVPLFLVIREESSRGSFKSGLIAGFPFFLGTFYWLLFPQLIFNFPLPLAIALTVLACIILAFSWGIFSLIANYILKERSSLAIFLIPVLWTGLEYLRSLLLTDGLTLGFIGYTQAYFTLLIQMASLVGVYGVTFFIILLNISLYKVILYYKQQEFLPIKERVTVLIMILLVLGYGVISLKTPADYELDYLKVGLMQPNIAQEIKWNFNYRQQIIDTYFELSAELIADGAELIIWPETAIPFVLNEVNANWENYLLERIKELRTPFFIGALNQIEDHTYNQSFLINQDLSISDSYSKLRLVPFGEYLPFRSILPDSIGTVVSDKTPGTEVVNFNFKDSSWASPICSEMLNPQLVSRLAVNNDFLISISNEAWFKKSNASMQIWQAMILRAVENRTTIIKVANTGISGIVDSKGVIQTKIKPFQEEAEVHPINLIKNEN